MFSRRSDARLNRGRIATAAGSTSLSPAAQFTSDILASTTRTNIWLVHGDAGVNQATTPGRLSSLTSQSGANDWTTATTTAEPTYAAADSTLNGKGTWATDGTAKSMRNAYDPPAPLTQPHYRISVMKVNRTLSGRAPVILSTAFAFGLVTDGTIRQVAHSMNTTVGPNLDLPALQWCIVEEYFSGSTSDFVTVGPVDNVASGVNLGNTNNASLAMSGSTTGTALADSSFAFSAAFLGLPTAPERAALRATIEAYYGPQVVRTRKVCRYFPVGDSITQNQMATSNDGWRKAIYDTFFVGLDYPVFSAGSTVQGTYNAEFTRNGGIPGNTIAQCSDYLFNVTTGQLRAGGPLINGVQLTLLMIGTNDMPTYAAGTTAAAYATLLDNIQAALPNGRIVVTTIIPRGDADNADAIAFNAELPAIWDAFDVANPTKTLTRWDANAAIGGPIYVAANYADTLHPNNTGHALLGAAVVAATASIFNTLTTY